MRNGMILLGAFVLFAVTAVCGETPTPPVAHATEYVPPAPPTTYVPPTIVPVVTVTEFVPPAVPPTSEAPSVNVLPAQVNPPFNPTIFVPAPGAPVIITAITKKYWSLGGANGLLGSEAGEQHLASDNAGYYREYQWGVIYWSEATDAHEVHGAILAKWTELGRETSFLGYPMTDETTTPDGIGRFNHFQGGSIYWTPDTGAHEVHGNIRLRWAELGWENSCLGYPISDEEPAGGDNRQSRFQHGIIVTGSNGPVETCY